MTASDIDHSIFTFQLITPVSLGTSSLNSAGQYTYTPPDESFSGSEYLIFTATDGS